MSTPTASAYVRLSREAGETNLSLDGMMRDLRDLADRLGVRLIAEHSDDGISGAVRDRPEFTAWLDDAREGRADVLLAYHTDRLTREGVNAAAMVLDVVEGKDPTTGRVIRTPVRLVTWDGLDSEKDAEAFRWRFVIAAEVARAERARIAERNTRTKARLRMSGRWSGGPRPYGYRPEVAEDGKGKILAVDPDEAAIVRRIAEEILAGESLYAIAVGLNADGIPSAKGGTWTRATVRNLVRSEHVLGRVSVAVRGPNGEPTRDRRPLLDEDGVPVVAWTPLLDLDTAERVRALTDSTPTPGRSEATIAGRRTRASRLLSGLLTCSCGAPLVVRRRKGVAYYGCADRARGLRTDRDRPCLLVDADKVEAEVEDRFLADAGRLPVVETITRVPAVAGLAEAERDLADASAEISTTAPSALPALFDRISTLSARRERLAALPSEPVVEVVETGETFAERWARLDDVAARRRMIADSGVVIEVAPARRRGFWDPERVCVTFGPQSEESLLRDFA
jgi:site-specific DNA recombinase